MKILASFEDVLELNSRIIDNGKHFHLELLMESGWESYHHLPRTNEGFKTLLKFLLEGISINLRDDLYDDVIDEAKIITTNGGDNE